MIELLLNQEFIEEGKNGLHEALLCSDDIGRFAAKQLYLEDIEMCAGDNEDYLTSMYMLNQQVEHLGALLTSLKKIDPTGTISADTVDDMLFKTKSYATLCALVYAIGQQQNNELPFEHTDFEDLKPNCDDLNRLVSRDENKLSKVLSEDEFAAFGDDYSAMLKWAGDPARRFTQVPPPGRYPVTDPYIAYDFSDLAETKGLIMPVLESKLALRSQALSKSLKEVLGDKGSLERYCCDRTGILSLSLALKFDYKAFLPWLDKALSEQYRNTSKVLAGLISNTASEDKRIYREDIVEHFSLSDRDIVPHPANKATSKLVPFLCVRKKFVIAVEMTKYGSIFMPRYCVGTDIYTELPDGMCKLYAPVTPSASPYGRNSNLRQIPELAWCELVKVKVRTQHELDRVMKLIE
ncbi:hypothetical protein [Photobacterium nomapromontoriensis]|uniref:hypothetical protein n=1 Tax=Photobacterium nomapromontoriensis TaxID=2910237 RepID=UPI003D0DA492